MPKPILSFSALVAAFATFNSAHAAGLPQQLLGKTVNFTYTVSVATKLPNGSIKSTSRTETRTIYVSSAGRMFMRNSRRNSANASETTEQGPEKTGGSLHYADGAIVGAVGEISGAYQFTIKFDPSFQSCDAKMIFGRTAGQAHHVWKSVGGETLESVGKGSVSTSCSVASGNSL